MERKDFFNFKIYLPGTYQTLMENKSPSKESKKNVKVNLLKIKKVKYEPAMNRNTYIDF